MSLFSGKYRESGIGLLFAVIIASVAGITWTQLHGLARNQLKARQVATARLVRENIGARIESILLFPDALRVSSQKAGNQQLNNCLSDTNSLLDCQTGVSVPFDLYHPNLPKKIAGRPNSESQYSLWGSSTLCVGKRHCPYKVLTAFVATCADNALQCQKANTLRLSYRIDYQPKIAGKVHKTIPSWPRGARFTEERFQLATSAIAAEHDCLELGGNGRCLSDGNGCPENGIFLGREEIKINGFPTGNLQPKCICRPGFKAIRETITERLLSCDPLGDCPYPTTFAGFSPSMEPICRKPRAQSCQQLLKSNPKMDPRYCNCDPWSTAKCDSTVDCNQPSANSTQPVRPKKIRGLRMIGPVKVVGSRVTRCDKIEVLCCEDDPDQFGF